MTIQNVGEAGGAEMGGGVFAAEQPQFVATDLDSLQYTESEARNATLSVRVAQVAIRRVMQEYLDASAYFRGIGAQTASSEYGGSRSMIYMQILTSASTVQELRRARASYTALHTDAAANHDEYGGLLRIAAYRLRRMPVVGGFLERKVRQDDAVMAQAGFTYPEGYTRYTAALDSVDEVA
jgi:hypothetical protein